MNLLKIEDLKDKELYKVNQIIINGTPMIFFAKEVPGYFHRDLLKDILLSNGLTYISKKLFRCMGPSLQGEKYHVQGMGGAILFDQKHVLLFGHSFEYGSNVSKEHTERLRQEEYPDWEFTVTHTPVGETL